MSLSRILLTTALIGGIAVATAAQGQGNNPAVAARPGQFQLLSLNLGVLGNMARGNSGIVPLTLCGGCDGNSANQGCG